MQTHDIGCRQARSRVRLAAAASLLLLTAACGGTSAGTGTSAGAGSVPSSTPTFSATSAAVSVATTSLGSILVTGQGRTIYMFAADKNGQSSCTGTCLQYWPIVPAPASMTPPSGVTATLGVLTRADGAKQLTVDGMPAYTFAGDAAPGSTSGQGKNTSGGLWWVLSPGGSVITAAPGTASAKPSASKSKGGYGY